VSFSRLDRFPFVVTDTDTASFDDVIEKGTAFREIQPGTKHAT
jgi:hypothetical protein